MTLQRYQSKRWMFISCITRKSNNGMIDSLWASNDEHKETE
jgi:hypothetical protein